ncbi:3'(2'),5'-bisphosphate nucleotidase CysQ [Lichenicola cladoniae]|uniref:3'(2'),5'-bisphosphate nucleotidase CysQ n=1 Tax=Lichenicola cladoniae TaxID=1484109 RepID=A0A6M8HMS2_9PROT|nr:3'(2'),5'-bisphosphate nucleotidase CysQ [Lichenicola cladoniae]NPD67095.1 3'(2'),5'-bisphosphate nucleotidase CysQ [Acetobacteraceae bacterium]QKE89635.1 3'(2'),5'-bisphosphate nucleotidase CysQ [Lichenicola cladoniae]
MNPLRTANAVPTDDEALLALAAELAGQAARIILDIRSRGFETLIKDDASPVTEADHQAETLILAGLRAGSSIPVIAEEEAAAGLVTEPGPEFWLVDPLDGTREFASGRDDFTVNIGLVRNGLVVLGAVALPAYGELYLGRVGHGATRRDRDGEVAIHVRPPPEAGLSVLASRHYADDPRLLEYLGHQRIATIGNIGSAAKFVRVAEGRADLYPRLGRTMEWDTAAPQAVVEAAGGSVTLFEGGPLRYGKPGWENPFFICRGGVSGISDD